MIPDIPAPLVAALADAPLAMVLLWLVIQLRKDLTARQDPPPAAPARDDLAEFKLEVARTYVPLSLIRDLDARLSLHLIRIEEKLDEVSRSATAAEAVSGQSLPVRKTGFARAAEPRA
jgi:hypothetical protein